MLIACGIGTALIVTFLVGTMVGCAGERMRFKKSIRQKVIKRDSGIITLR